MTEIEQWYRNRESFPSEDFQWLPYLFPTLWFVKHALHCWWCSTHTVVTADWACQESTIFLCVIYYSRLRNQQCNLHWRKLKNEISANFNWQTKVHYVSTWFACNAYGNEAFYYTQVIVAEWLGILEISWSMKQPNANMLSTPSPRTTEIPSALVTIITKGNYKWWEVPITMRFRQDGVSAEWTAIFEAIWCIYMSIA